MPTQFRDYYETLGVSRKATSAELQKAFRSLARKFHPDVNADDPEAESKFKDLNEAYEVLSDPAKRRRYDELGPRYANRGYTPPAGNAWDFSGTGFSDFFEELFGKAQPGQAAGHTSHANQNATSSTATDVPPGAMPGTDKVQAFRGKDIQAELLVTLHEVLNGGAKKLYIKRRHSTEEDSGKEVLQITIPKGIRQGQTIRLPGKGREGSYGGGAGDLLLNVRYAQHPDFIVQGEDLALTLDLAPWEAVLGGIVQIPTIDKPAKLTIKPGSNSGAQLRIRGQGLPRKDGTRGDILVTLRIALPDKLDRNDQKLWKQIAAKSHWNPRAEL